MIVYLLICGLLLFGLWILFFRSENNKKSKSSESIFYTIKESKKSKTKISILTYNILGQMLLKRKNRNGLNLQNRMKIIIGEIQSLNPDVICLQEATWTSFKSYICPNLSQVYSFEYIENTGSSLMNVTGVRKNRLKFRKKEEIDTTKINVEGNRGILFTDILGQETNFAVYNVHFPWRPIYEYEKCEMYNLIMEHMMINSTKDIFIAGDFNSIPNSIFLRLIYYEDFMDELVFHKDNYSNLTDRGEFQFNKKEKYLVKKFIEDTDEKINRKFTKILTNSQKICHDFRFKSAYEQYIHFPGSDSNRKFSFLRNHPEFTNFTERFQNTIDYIFYSKHFHLCRLLKLPEREEVTKENFLPNSKFPSDHLKLFAEFNFES